MGPTSKGREGKGRGLLMRGGREGEGPISKRGGREERGDGKEGGNFSQGE